MKTLYEQFIEYVTSGKTFLTPAQDKLAKAIFEAAEEDKEIRTLLLGKNRGKEFFFKLISNFLNS